MAALLVCKPAWLEAIRASYHEYPTTQELLTRIVLDPASEPEYQLQNGILRFKGRVWIVADKETQHHQRAAC